MAKNQRKVGKDKSGIVKAIPRACSDETAAVEFMEQQRWGDEPCCPRCGDIDVYKMTDSETGHRNRRFLWRCRGCKRQFTVRIGTVFEESRIPLRHWCYAFWRACTSKKGVAALEIKRQTGLSYKSSLFLMHRIRYAMAAPKQEKLNGTVEADESWIGARKRGTGSGLKIENKTAVMALIQRNGPMRARVVGRVTKRNLNEALDEFVDKSSRLLTDENQSYKRIGPAFQSHDTVCHSRGEYSRGDVHVNTCESFFAIFKRGLHGIWHSVSKKHLHRYLSAAEFRFNHRKLEDGERTVLAIRGAEGKRLMYRQPALG